MIDTPERPTYVCATCPPPRDERPWRQADPGYRTCSACLDRIRDTLKDVVRRYLLLNPRPGASGEHGGRAAPGFGSRSPASEHIIAMRDRRSSRIARTWRAPDGRLHQEQERPPLSVHGVLDTIAWDIAERRDVSGPDPRADVPELARFIDSHLDWATRQDDVVDLHQAVRELAAQLRPVTGEPGRRHIGHCPNTVDDGDATKECGARLYAPLRGDAIECSTCGRVWPRSEWLRLGHLLDAS